MDLNHLSSQIIKATIAVHKELGPGLLESVYHSCMLIELKAMGIKVESEVPLPIFYRGQKLDGQEFRLDLLVEDKIIVELKSAEKVEALHKKQLLTYLRLAEKPLGLLINFNQSLLKDGITRIINAPPTADRVFGLILPLRESGQGQTFLSELCELERLKGAGERPSKT
jgi:GxxExxY protein